MKKIIISQGWWSIGKCSIGINQTLNYIKLLKTNYPNLFYYILNFEGPDFIIQKCIPDLGEFVDEYHINNFEFSDKNLKSNPNYFFQFNPICYFYVTELDEIIKIITLNKFDNVLPEFFLSSFYEQPRILENFKAYIEILPDFELVKQDSKSEIEIFVEFSDEQKSIANEILIKKNIDEFETIHFRAHYSNSSKYRKEIIYYWIDRVTPFINPHKKYFISSSDLLFCKIFEEKFSNCFYLDREIYLNSKNNLQRDEFFLPKDFELPFSFQQINDYIAYLDLSIICKSKKIIHMSDGYRNMISLFLWLPLMKYEIPLTWIATTYNIQKKYNLNGCYFQELDPIQNEIEIPFFMCDYSNGHFCK